MEQIYLLLLLVLVGVAVLFLLVNNPRRGEFSKLPPGPYPLPILGNFLHLLEKPHVALANLAKLHGPLMSIKLGAKIVIVGSSHEAATQIFKLHDREISSRVVPRPIGKVVGECADHLTLMGAADCNHSWKMMRTIVKTELFSSKAIDSKLKLRADKVKELTAFLRTKEGCVLNVKEVAFSTAINIISNIIFSKDFINIADQGMVAGLQRQIRSIEKLASIPYLGDFFPIFCGLDVQGLGNKFVEYSKRLFPSWEVFIDGRKEAKNVNVAEKKDFLDALLANGFSKDQINWFISEVFITSIDSSSTAIESIMSELIKHPEAMSKLREELAKEVGGNIVREDDLPRLPYLNACVKETLRLHPPVTIMYRRVTQTCQVMNYTIPKGTRVWLNLWAVGREEAKWEDPFTFKPSRFLQSNLDFKGGNFEFLPFGAGMRICPGLPLAARVVPLIVASMIHSFDWNLPDKTSHDDLDMNEKLGITLKREKPLLLIPKSKSH